MKGVTALLVRTPSITIRLMETLNQEICSVTSKEHDFRKVVNYLQETVLVCIDCDAVID